MLPNSPYLTKYPVTTFAADNEVSGIFTPRREVSFKQYDKHRNTQNAGSHGLRRCNADDGGNGR